MDFSGADGLENGNISRGLLLSMVCTQDTCCSAKRLSTTCDFFFNTPLLRVLKTTNFEGE